MGNENISRIVSVWVVDSSPLSIGQTSFLSEKNVWPFLSLFVYFLRKGAGGVGPGP